MWAVRLVEAPARSPRWRPDVHVYDVGRASMWRLCVRVLCLSCARLDAVPFGPWLSVWGYGKTNFRFVYLPEMDVAEYRPN